MKIFTIGFAGKSAERFFALLKQPGLRRIVDVRLHNLSQLAGFAKQGDLAFFARELCGIDYLHRLELAPEAKMLDAYRKDGGSWEDYAARFLELMARRRVEALIPRELIDGACLLCSEPSPEQCHRRLVAEYLQSKWGGLQVEDLV